MLTKTGPGVSTIYSPDDTFGLRNFGYMDASLKNASHHRLDGQHFISFYFYSDQISVKTQQLAYDIYSFFGEAGGAFGFFLGLSMVNVHDLMANAVKKLFPILRTE